MTKHELFHRREKEVDAVIKRHAWLSLIREGMSLLPHIENTRQAFVIADIWLIQSKQDNKKPSLDIFNEVFRSVDLKKSDWIQSFAYAICRAAEAWYNELALWKITRDKFSNLQMHDLTKFVCLNLVSKQPIQWTQEALLSAITNLAWIWWPKLTGEINATLIVNSFMEHIRPKTLRHKPNTFSFGLIESIIDSRSRKLVNRANKLASQGKIEQAITIAFKIEMPAYRLLILESIKTWLELISSKLNSNRLIGELIDKSWNIPDKYFRRSFLLIIAEHQAKIGLFEEARQIYWLIDKIYQEDPDKLISFNEDEQVDIILKMAQAWFHHEALNKALLLRGNRDYILLELVRMQTTWQLYETAKYTWMCIKNEQIKSQALEIIIFAQANHWMQLCKESELVYPQREQNVIANDILEKIRTETEISRITKGIEWRVFAKSLASLPNIKPDGIDTIVDWGYIRICAVSPELEAELVLKHEDKISSWVSLETGELINSNNKLDFRLSTEILCWFGWYGVDYLIWLASQINPNNPSFFRILSSLCEANDKKAIDYVINIILHSSETPFKIRYHLLKRLLISLNKSEALRKLIYINALVFCWLPETWEYAALKIITQLVNFNFLEDLSLEQINNWAIKLVQSTIRQLLIFKQIDL